MVTGAPYHFRKSESEWNCLLQCSFLNVKIHFFRDRELKDAMHSVLMYCLFAYTWKLKNTYTNVTSLAQTLNSGSNLTFNDIFFLFHFLMQTILFLYSLGNQRSADLPFHMLCYQCCLQLPQFAAHVVRMNSVAFAMFQCICTASCF